MKTEPRHGRLQTMVKVSGPRPCVTRPGRRHTSFVLPAAYGTGSYFFWRRLLLPVFCLLPLALSCGYQVAGRGDRLPPDIKTLAVPIFTNDTSRFRIEQKVSAAITREFIERTRFRITPDPAGADAVLNGAIKDVRSGVVAFDPTTGRATTLQIQVVTQVELVDTHTHKIVFSNPNYVFREQYQISLNPSALFEEDEPALDRLSRDLARTLVTEILENF